MAENHWTGAIQRKLHHSRILQLRERHTHESWVSTTTHYTSNYTHILMSLKMTLAYQKSPVLLFYRDLAKMGISCSAHQRKILSSVQDLLSGLQQRQDKKIPVWSVTKGEKNDASCWLAWITRGTEYFTSLLHFNGKLMVWRSEWMS